jgi:hypothetical protein
LASDCYTCFLYHLQVTASVCYYKHLHHPRICLLYPLILTLFLAWSIPFILLDLLVAAQPWRHQLPFRLKHRLRSFW